MKSRMESIEELVSKSVRELKNGTVDVIIKDGEVYISAKSVESACFKVIMGLMSDAANNEIYNDELTSANLAATGLAAWVAAVRELSLEKKHED